MLPVRQSIELACRDCSPGSPITRNSTPKTAWTSAEDPASGHWFAFINRRQDRLKLLGWDGQGFWIWYKRLESGAFEKPTAGPNRRQMEIDVTQLSLIINGIDLGSAKRRRRYSRAG